jgi:acetyl-CoA acetyltransferase
MSDAVWIVGTAMTPFGRFPDKDHLDLASSTALGALADGALSMRDMGVMAVGNQFDSILGLAQRLQKQIGQTGIPAYNVMNACATGASALRVVHLAIKAGEADAGLAVGVEIMGKAGLLGPAAKAQGAGDAFERSGRNGQVMPIEGVVGTGLMPGVFAKAGLDYAGRHDGVGLEQFARVAEKNHAHSVLNPLSQYRKAFSFEQIVQGEMIAYPNTLLMCCPTADGSAAAVLVSDAKLRTLPMEVQRRAVKISGVGMATDPYGDGAAEMPDINTPTRLAAAAAYEQAGLGPEDLDLVELHDCFATAELLHYDNLGLCEPGGAGDFIDSGAPWRDGKIPVNVSGGLLSKGHPIGATGIANIYEVTTHLRGEAGERQVGNARVGLTHVVGLGTTSVVHVLESNRGVGG